MSNRTFVLGLVVCALIMLAFGAAVAALNAGNNRPEGVAEDWLTAVGDTVREGVERDARERAEKIGDVSLARNIVSRNTDGEAAFSSLEVGKAVGVREGRLEYVKVRFRAFARVGDEEVERNGILDMRHVGDDWEVIGIDDRGFDMVPALPSDGGPPPSSAPVTLWLGALVAAGVIGLVCSALVRAA